MASKRGKKRKQCGRKQGFALQENAIKKAIEMRRKHLGQIFDAYRCTNCGLWHIGHRPASVSQAMRGRKR